MHKYIHETSPYTEKSRVELGELKRETQSVEMPQSPEAT